jgi:hypothetical protein
VQQFETRIGSNSVDASAVEIRINAPDDSRLRDGRYFTYRDEKWFVLMSRLVALDKSFHITKQQESPRVTYKK